MNPEIRTIFLHLSLIDGVGPAAIARIASHNNGQQLDQLYHYSASDCRELLKLPAKTAQKLVAGLADFALLERELQLIQKHSISWTTVCDSDYPDLLRSIHLPPTVLYWQGMLPGTQSIAIVGSRDANSYGRMAIQRLVPELVAHDWTIVSGGARGADTMAHQKALELKGTTVAVLGSGLLRPYPPANKRLFDDMVAQGGAVVSALPLLMDPLSENFPARNRIIAGLSRGCIVIQAAERSGARITADFCLSQGREVFAVPGPIDDPLSYGCHALIGQGAKLISSATDVLVEFGYQIPVSKPDKKSQKNGGQQELFIPAAQAVPVDPREDAIMELCKHPCSIDELLDGTGIALIELSKMLFDLQIKGKLSQNMAGLWQRH